MERSCQLYDPAATRRDETVEIVASRVRGWKWLSKYLPLCFHCQSSVYLVLAE